MEDVLVGLSVAEAMLELYVALTHIITATALLQEAHLHTQGTACRSDRLTLDQRERALEQAMVVIGHLSAGRDRLVGVEDGREFWERSSFPFGVLYLHGNVDGDSPELVLNVLL